MDIAEVTAPVEEKLEVEQAADHNEEEEEIPDNNEGNIFSFYSFLT